MRTIVLAAAFLFVVLGCSKKHLSKDFGRSYVQAFTAQQDRAAGKKPADATRGLDSQEAAITADNYRAGLAPKGEEATEEPVVIVAPPARDRPQQLAPSVPKE